MQLLPWRHAKRYLRPGFTLEKWNEVRIQPNDDTVIEVMRHRMPEAWQAANSMNERHVATIFAQFECFAWFLGETPEDAKSRFWDRFEFFGKPQLVLLAEQYELGDWKALDDGLWQLKAIRAALPAAEALEGWKKRGLRAAGGSG